MSDIEEINNVRCNSNKCKKEFCYNNNDKIIRCPHCGYRIIEKLRTKQSITYKTE